MRTIIVLMVGMMLVGVLSCGKDDNPLSSEKKIVGTWDIIDDDGDIFRTCDFRSSGVSECSYPEGSYFEGKVIVFSWKIEDNMLSENPVIDDGLPFHPWIIEWLDDDGFILTQSNDEDNRMIARRVKE